MPRSSRLAPPIEHDDRDPRRARIEQRGMTSDTAHQPAVGFVQRTPPDSATAPAAAGSVTQSALEEPNHLGAVHFTDPAAQELAPCARPKTVWPRGAPRDREAVIERRRHTQLRQMRAHPRLRRRDPFAEAAFVEQQLDAPRARHSANLRAVERLRMMRCHSISAAACARRRLTTAGVCSHVVEWRPSTRPTSGAV